MAATPQVPIQVGTAETPNAAFAMVKAQEKATGYRHQIRRVARSSQFAIWKLPTKVHP